TTAQRPPVPVHAESSKWSGLQASQAPPRFPMGVRTAPTITASRIERIHAEHVPRGIRRFSTSRLPRRDKETGFHAPRPVRGLDPSGPGEIPAKKVKHVVIILKENHTFDNYFGTFPGANGTRLPRSPNPPTRDHSHTHAAWLARQTTAAREQFIEQDIPAYFSYARKF